jgi:hypothetical protein
MNSMRYLWYLTAVVLLLAGQALWAGPSDVKFAPHGALMINGKGVFPIGFTMPPPAHGVTPWGRAGLEELADAGATFLRTGPMAVAWTDETIANEQKYLDQAAKYGLYCATNLREYSSVKEGEPKEAKLRELVERFKDHPALGVWKGVDEPQWGKHPVEPMLRAYEIIHKLDGRHPVFVVQAPRGKVEELRAYDATYDITGADIYPISYPPGGHSIDANDHISMVGDFTKKMMDVASHPPDAQASDRAAAPHPKPVWMVLQISFSGTIKPGKTLRMPSFPETRFMTYQAIINGARGLLFFGGHIDKAIPEADKKYGWAWTHWRRVLRPVIEEIGSKSPLYPALLAPESKLAIKCSDPKVEFCVREVGNDIFILACKREGDAVKDTKQATFVGLPGELADAEVMFESPRRVEVKGGALTDWFAPFDVHVYRIRKAQ